MIEVSHYSCSARLPKVYKPVRSSSIARNDKQLKLSSFSKWFQLRKVQTPKTIKMQHTIKNPHKLSIRYVDYLLL